MTAVGHHIQCCFFPTNLVLGNQTEVLELSRQALWWWTTFPGSSCNQLWNLFPFMVQVVNPMICYFFTSKDHQCRPVLNLPQLLAASRATRLFFAIFFSPWLCFLPTFWVFILTLSSQSLWDPKYTSLFSSQAPLCFYLFFQYFASSVL